MRTRSPLPWLLPCLLLLALAPRSEAFCGFYVARADSRIFNQASQVILVRDGDRTVLTMANDFSGAPEEFAVVIPVPTVLQKEQIHVADMALVDHLDAYTAPRLVEYFDPDPCQLARERRFPSAKMASPALETAASDRREGLGVTIEASYTVGEYDILILSAKESGGLVTWLSRNGYRIPDGAEAVVGSYLKQGMKFFVAKVNLKEKAALGFSKLRPLQVAFETSKFMLPIRLGTVNAQGAQELFVYFLTRQGRVETTNYRTVNLPTDIELPAFLKSPDEFSRFYRDMFQQQMAAEHHRGVFLEYAWDMAWCDPCAADPLSGEELRQLGVFWADAGDRGQAQNAFVTRLHLRYDGEHFPDDLRFQQTADRSNFQGRYILRHPWQGEASCAAAREYRETLPQRFEQEAQRLASLTRWPLAEIRQKMGGLPVPAAAEEVPWWRRLWGS